MNCKDFINLSTHCSLLTAVPLFMHHHSRSSIDKRMYYSGLDSVRFVCNAYILRHKHLRTSNAAVLFQRQNYFVFVENRTHTIFYVFCVFCPSTLHTPHSCVLPRGRECLFCTQKVLLLCKQLLAARSAVERHANGFDRNPFATRPLSVVSFLLVGGRWPSQKLRLCWKSLTFPYFIRIRFESCCVWRKFLQLLQCEDDAIHLSSCSVLMTNFQPSSEYGWRALLSLSSSQNNHS